jgi:hypothetical protein
MIKINDFVKMTIKKKNIIIPILNSIDINWRVFVGQKWKEDFGCPWWQCYKAGT